MPDLLAKLFAKERIPKAGDPVKKNRRDATRSRAFTRRTVETSLWSGAGHDVTRDLVWQRSAALQPWRERGNAGEAIAERSVAATALGTRSINPGNRRREQGRPRRVGVAPETTLPGANGSLLRGDGG
jgi:hypothetical protein